MSSFRRPATGPASFVRSAGTTVAHEALPDGVAGAEVPSTAPGAPVALFCSLSRVCFGGAAET